MIFTKKYIRQVILQEMADYIGMKNKLKSKKNTKLDSLRQELINFFIQYRAKATDMAQPAIKDPKKSLEKEMNSIKQKYNINLSYSDFLMFCIHTLRDQADPQLINFIKNIARGDRRFEKYLDKLDSYGMSIGPEEEKYISNDRKDPDPGFMRVPKTDNAAYDQEDLRKDIKTLVK